MWRPRPGARARARKTDKESDLQSRIRKSPVKQCQRSRFSDASTVAIASSLMQSTSTIGLCPPEDNNVPHSSAACRPQGIDRPAVSCSCSPSINCQTFAICHGLKSMHALVLACNVSRLAKYPSQHGSPDQRVVLELSSSLWSSFMLIVSLIDSHYCSYLSLLKSHLHQHPGQPQASPHKLREHRLSCQQ